MAKQIVQQIDRYVYQQMIDMFINRQRELNGKDRYLRIRKVIPGFVLIYKYLLEQGVYYNIIFYILYLLYGSFKGTVSVISSDTPYNDVTGFTTDPLSAQLCRSYVVVLDLEVFNADNFYMLSCSRNVKKPRQKKISFQNYKQ